MRKRITSVLLVLTMMLGLFPNITMALDIAGGSYGTNISWNYDVSSRTLTISGSGKIADHNFMTDDPLPWSEYTDEITHLVIENGITEIGDSVFGGEYSGETLP